MALIPRPPRTPWGWLAALLLTAGRELVSRGRPDDEGLIAGIARRARHPPAARVSLGGGYQPCWRGDGGELVYFRRDGLLMAAAIRDEKGLPVPGTPEELFPAAFARPTMKQYQLRGDGERLLMKFPAPEGEPVALQVTLNWPALLR